MSKKLDNIKLVVSDLTGKIMLARFGKNPNLALDHREAEQDFFLVIEKMCGEKGLEWEFNSPDFNYEIKVKKTKLKK